ncbi:MAG: transporter [Actinomycetota bacterium]|nr:transporter [Actinomycetota bacterium]
MTGDRVLLTLATLAFAAGVSLLMLRGWRSRQRRQADVPPPPRPPADPGPPVTEPVRGVFVGTTSAADWLDRIAVHGLSTRAAATLTVHETGVLVARDGADDLWLPYDDVLDAESGDALAGKVVGRDGLLIVTWRLGDRTLLSGFRGPRSAHPALAEAVRARLPLRPALPREEAP